MHATRLRFIIATLLTCGSLCWMSGLAAAQGVTTSSMAGIVKDTQGGVLPGVLITAVHGPSGTTYTIITQTAGRFFIPGMRVGGPYKVTASLSGFNPETKDGLTLTLGEAQDLEFSLKLATVTETIEVKGESNTAPIRPPPGPLIPASCGDPGKPFSPQHAAAASAPTPSDSSNVMISRPSF